MPDIKINLLESSDNGLVCKPWNLSFKEKTSFLITLRLIFIATKILQKLCQSLPIISPARILRFYCRLSYT
uniref:Uncharacterized protein n=1 Tax=Lepeophtheirus salmonis TaxID=72036 RepID=A0A0K2UP36_LEPSM